MSDTLERLRSEIDSLSKEDREQLSASLSFSTRSADPSLSRGEQAVFTAIREITGSRAPQSVFLRDYGLRKFRGRVEEVFAFISESRHLLRPPEVDLLIEKCLECLASDLRSREIPVTPATLLNSMGMLRHVVDQRFPGYAAAGHLHRLVRSRDPAPAE